MTEAVSVTPTSTSVSTEKDTPNLGTYNEDDAHPPDTPTEQIEEYPTGWKLGMIIVALMLSMFLVCYFPF